VARISRSNFLLLLAGVAAISSAALLIREADAPPLVTAASRMLIAAVVLIPFCATRVAKALKKLNARDGWLIAVSGIALSLHFWLWITSLSYTSIASSVVLVTSHPALVALLSFILWREHLPRVAFLGIFIAFAGLVVINVGNFTTGSRALEGNLMALAAAGAITVYLIVGRHVRERIDAQSYLTMVYSLAAVLLTGAALIAGEKFSGYPSKTYWMLGLLGLLPQLIGHTSLNLAVRRLPATIVSVAILGEPVGATFLGWVFLGEAPAAKEVAGGIVILLGILLVIAGGWRESVEQV
jgi:drug/metabolite transporter (DMT)-like permease